MEIDRKELEEIKTSLIILNSSLKEIDKILNNLGIMPEKISNLDLSLKLIEQRLENTTMDIVSRRRESENSLESLKITIDRLNVDQTKNVNEKISHILEEIKESRKQTELREKDIHSKLEAQKNVLEEKLEKLNLRVSNLEQWKLWIMGVGIGVTSIVTLIWKTFLG
jgi:signal recognition particle subunit SEC65